MKLRDVFKLLGLETRWGTPAYRQQTRITHLLMRKEGGSGRYINYSVRDIEIIAMWFELQRWGWCVKAGQKEQRLEDKVLNFVRYNGWPDAVSYLRNGTSWLVIPPRPEYLAELYNQGEQS